MLRNLLRRTATSPFGIAPLSTVLAAALVTVGWLDYSSARREFNGLVRAQAASARDTVAAAARANSAAGTEAREQLAERLLDNARLIAEIDKRGTLSTGALEDIASRNHLFRITVLAPDGTREQFIVPEGQGGGPGIGYNAGAGAGGAILIERLLQKREQEAVTDLHEGYRGGRGGVARLAAGVRRANGGAILLSVDATEVANLQKQSSIDALLADIVRSTEDVAYIVFDADGQVKTSGDPPPAVALRGGPTATGAAQPAERRLTVQGRPILELTSPVDIGGPRRASLTLGMRLDRLRQAERRTMVRLAVSLASAATLGFLALGLAWFRREFGALSAEHALAQDALRRRDRLSAMGELASTVAHEIRNPLNAIAMSAQRLKKECIVADDPDGDGAGELVDVIQREAQRINGKVQQFLEFARPPALQRQEQSVGPWLAAIVAAVKPLAESRHVRLDVDVVHAGIASFDAEQMRQAVDNLLLNAIEATPGDGRVSVRGSVTSRELTIEVVDTGAGIDAAHLPRIFDLYFTTKSNGTGVGLAVTQQIVAAHGGTVEVDSEPSRGTTMRIRVPATGSVEHA